eukprot:Gregarina_sp_Poly_1__9704@NODE_616_length_7127_cov_52_867989_g472_i0_p1_GENE_NODE_616_length_7127_cov_52_867989_g472_i0NODE_616_length_7127_cov_52_867989_g472_i0_p1_ORF_typecomplete_len509_score63_15RAB3GAP2_N/PF14655_6/2_6e19_NODE_616_length_7127_cov_52_867989_g472_i08492375
MLVEHPDLFAYNFETKNKIQIASVLGNSVISLCELSISNDSISKVSQREANCAYNSTASSNGPRSLLWVSLPRDSIYRSFLLVLHESGVIQFLTEEGVSLLSWDFAESFILRKDNDPFKSERFVKIDLVMVPNSLVQAVCVISDLTRILLMPLDVLTALVNSNEHFSNSRPKGLPYSFILELSALQQQVSRINLDIRNEFAEPPSLARSVMSADQLKGRGLMRFAAQALGLSRDHEGLQALNEIPSVSEMSSFFLPEPEFLTSHVRPQESFMSISETPESASRSLTNTFVDSMGKRLASTPAEVLSSGAPFDISSEWRITLWGKHPFMSFGLLIEADDKPKTRSLLKRFGSGFAANTSVGETPLKRLIVKPVVSLLSRMFGDHSAEVVAMCPWSSSLVIVRDSLNRVCLLRRDCFRILYWWKGYREASLGWAKSTDGHNCALLLAPSKGLLEVWKLDGDGIHKTFSEKVPKQSFIMNADCVEGFTVLCLRSTDSNLCEFSLLRWTNLP